MVLLKGGWSTRSLEFLLQEIQQQQQKEKMFLTSIQEWRLLLRSRCVYNKGKFSNTFLVQLSFGEIKYVFTKWLFKERFCRCKKRIFATPHSKLFLTNWTSYKQIFNPLLPKSPKSFRHKFHNFCEKSKDCTWPLKNFHYPLFNELSK